MTYTKKSSMYHVLMPLLLLQLITVEASAAEIVSYKSKRRCGTVGIEVTFRHDTRESRIMDLDTKSYCVDDRGNWELALSWREPVSDIVVSSDDAFSYNDPSGSVSVDGKIDTKKKKAIGTVRQIAIPLCAKKTDFQECRAWEARPAK